MPTVAPMAGEGALASIINAGATGAIQQGGLNALNQLSQGGNINAGQLAQQTALGGAFGGALGTAGQAFEKIQPSISQFLSKIPKEDYQTILDSIKAGENPFAGKATPLKDLQEQAESFATKQSEALSAQKAAQTSDLATQKATTSNYGDLQNQYAKEQLDNFKSNTQAELDLHKDNSQQILQSLKDRQSNEQDNAIQTARNLAEQTSDTVNKVQGIYGKQVGQQVAALKDTDNIPLSDINNLIDSNIKGASQGTELNPAGQEASTLGGQLKSMLLRGALKNQGLNDAQINAYINKSTEGMTGLEDSTRQALQSQGMNPLEINQHIDTLKQNGFMGNENAMTTGNVPQINSDDLNISQKGIHVLKQYLQSRKINYEAESNPVSGIVKNIAGDLNNTLRNANPNYANVNDQYSELAQFLNKPENSFFNNTDSLASKFANISNKSSITSDTLNKTKQLENLMQESRLNPNISGQLEDIKNLPNKHSEQLSDLQNGLNSQKQQILNNHTQQGRQLSNELTQNSIYFKKDTQSKLQDFMNEQQQQAQQLTQQQEQVQQAFNQQQQIPLARTSFEKVAPTTSGIGYAGHEAMGVYGTASLMHGNVIPAAAHGLYAVGRSPLTQKALLQAYGAGRQIPQSLYQYMLNQGIQGQQQGQQQ
jgi:hypothetical protein